MIDDAALATGRDPIEFRLAHLDDPREEQLVAEDLLGRLVPRPLLAIEEDTCRHRLARLVVVAAVDVAARRTADALLEAGAQDVPLAAVVALAEAVASLKTQRTGVCALLIVFSIAHTLQRRSCYYEQYNNYQLTTAAQQRVINSSCSPVLFSGRCT